MIELYFLELLEQLEECLVDLEDQMYWELCKKRKTEELDPDFLELESSRKDYIEKYKEFIKGENEMICGFEKAKGYEDIDFNLPVRKTKYSAGYDFELIEDLTLAPKETKLVPTGIKAKMPNNYVLLLFIRSSLGIKKHLRQTLGVSVIDADYYGNVDNDGHIMFPITNDGELKIELKKGDRIGQGVFVKYGVTDDDHVTAERLGGVGSTTK